jgi:Bacterial transglutaminase-like N-terminal region
MLVRRKELHHEAHAHHPQDGVLLQQPVRFGPHRAMMRPREGHDAHIARARVHVEPKADVSWLRDTYDNSIAILTFQAASNRLCVESEVDVDLYYDSLNEWPISPHARSFPFQYPPEEHIDLMVYRLPSYPYDGPMLHGWLQDLYQPGQVVNTLDLLSNLNSHIYRSFKYDSRDAFGVQLPNETLTRGSGTCRTSRCS